MLLGAIMQPASPAPETGETIRYAKQLEDLGFDSLWVVHAAGRGFLLPDPLLTLAAAAAATTKPKLGTAILQLPLYAPGDLALRILSLQHLAGDRLQIGLGAGSTADDFAVHEKHFDSRFADFNAKLETLRELLTGGASGEIDLAPPANLKGGPPLLLGTWGKGVQRAASEFSGWIASGAYRDIEQLTRALHAYREHGGERAIVSTIVLGQEAEPGQHRARLEQYAQAGFDEAVVMIRPDGPDPKEVRSWI